MHKRQFGPLYVVLMPKNKRFVSKVGMCFGRDFFYKKERFFGLKSERKILKPPKSLGSLSLSRQGQVIRNPRIELLP